MIQLIRQSTFLSKVFGTEKFNLETEYKLSVFNFSLSTEDRRIVVYNTLCNSMIVLSEDVWRSLCLDVNRMLKTLDAKDSELLVGCGVLTKATLDEVKLYLERFAFLQDMSKLMAGIVRYNIYTTTHCNARCFYCFEEGITKEHMSLATADKVAEFVNKTYSHESDEIYFRWFGGEPLVNTKVITRICEYARTKGISYFSSTSTNGLLLNEEMLELGRKVWNLKKVRFSLDGMGEVHNARKSFVGYRGNAFDVTIGNVDRAIKSGVQVVVRLTIDLNNADSISDLAEMLINRYAGASNLKLYTKCIFSEVSIDKYKRDPNAVKELLKINSELTERVIATGLYDCERLAPAGLRTYYCAANDPHKVVISPSGALCSCECNCVHSEFWGDVVNGITDAKRYEKWHSIATVRKCECTKCSMLPVCTPFVDICPSDYFSCHDRFFTTMRLFMRENYRRFMMGQPLLPDSDTFDKFKFN